MNERDGDDERLHRIAADPRYRALVRLRGRISWSLSIVVVAIFFGAQRVRSETGIGATKAAKH